MMLGIHSSFPTIFEMNVHVPQVQQRGGSAKLALSTGGPASGFAEESPATPQNTPTSVGKCGDSFETEATCNYYSRQGDSIRERYGHYAT